MNDYEVIGSGRIKKMFVKAANEKMAAFLADVETGIAKNEQISIRRIK